MTISLILLGFAILFLVFSLIGCAKDSKVLKRIGQVGGGIVAGIILTWMFLGNLNI